MDISVPQTGQEDLMSPWDVSRRLGIGKRSVYHRLASGDLAYHRVGRLVRIRNHDLNAYLARTRVEARNRYERHS